MKRFLLLFSLIIAPIIFPQQKYYTFSELKGIEDTANHTHLFYRMYYSHQTSNSYEMENSIYHFDLNSESDTLFLFDGGGYGPVGDPSFTRVFDYKFWDNRPDEFIYSGYYSSTDADSYIKRFDDDGGYLQLGGSNFYKVQISHQNDSLLYAYVMGTLKSTDGGRTWNSFNPSIIFQSLSPFNDSTIFADSGTGNLIKSTDGGIIFSIVDTNKSAFNFGRQFNYDPDGIHIYRIDHNYNYYKLFVSDHYGDAYSWSAEFFDTSKVFLSIDNSQSGKIYLADGRRIYVSEDYGSTFNQFMDFNRSLVGIYKKPSSQLLFTATKYDLYEIDPDTVITLKHLNPDPDIFKWYPLQIGNKWFYQHQIEMYSKALTVEVIRDSIISGKLYYVTKYVSPGEPTTYTLERIDSTDGKVYRYIDGSDIPYYDFTAQDVGDSVLFDREDSNVYGWVLEAQEPFDQWGINSIKNTYSVLHYTSAGQMYDFVKDVGIYFEQFGSEMYDVILLKGFIKDGVVYGDTILSVNNDRLLTIRSFKLEQNYPNPFNPTTNIGFRIANFGFVSLKVYDFLGREVATLVNEIKKPGKYEVNFDGSQLSSGIYFYRIKAGNFIQTKKMILLK